MRDTGTKKKTHIFVKSIGSSLRSESLTVSNKTTQNKINKLNNAKQLTNQIKKS